MYVGYSGTDLYKTLYRHFQEWNDRKAERVTYFKRMSQRSYTVRIVYCTPLQAYKLESGLIKMYEPRDNLNSMDWNSITQGMLTQVFNYEDIPVEREAPF